MKIKLPIFSLRSLKEASGWLILILGLLFYVGGYVLLYHKTWMSQTWPNVEFWANVSVSIGDILLISGVLGFLSGMAQWKGIFIDELTNLIYGKEMLSKRVDLKVIWENTTKQMFKNKFRCIHRDILDTMSHYLPDDNEISYYDNFTDDIVVKWVDRDRGIINTLETMSFDIVAESTDSVDYEVLSISTVRDTSKDPKDCIKHTIYVDGRKLDDLTSSYQRDGDKVIMTTKTRLAGAKRYVFKFIIDKTYCIYEDFTIGYKTKRYIHNLHVSMLLDDGIEAEFLARGEYEPFREVKNTKQNIIMAHTGVILPKQGFVFALQPTK